MHFHTADGIYSGLLIAMPAVTNPWLQNQKKPQSSFFSCFSVLDLSESDWSHTKQHLALGLLCTPGSVPEVLTHADVCVHGILHYFGS